MIIRPANTGDIDALLALSQTISGGMTSMPSSREAWEQKLALVEQSFSCKESFSCKQDSIYGQAYSLDHTVTEALYFLVLEDTRDGSIAGCAAVHVGVGLKRPFYNYRIARHVKCSHLLDITTNCQTLNLVNDFTGETELVSLYLRPDLRGSGLGQLLSRCRFALMYDFPTRFGQRIFAEIRGWLDTQGYSPFWHHLGKNFFNISYQEADEVCAIHGTQFISDLMPKYPIYVELLPQTARDVIGKPHEESAQAMKLLGDIGFRYYGALDIFDAGPIVECPREDIRLFNCAVNKKAKIEKKSIDDTCSNYLLSNRQLINYRITKQRLHLNLDDDFVSIPPDVAKRLNLSTGDPITIMPLKGLSL